MSPSDDVEGGLCCALFVSADLGDVDADAFGEGCLGESLVVSELVEVAERSPTAAVMEAHAVIERELRQLLTAHGVADSDQRAGASGLARLDVQRGIVTEETVKAVEGLSVLRNLAAHGRAGDVTTERAIDYLALADAVLYAVGGGNMYF